MTRLALFSLLLLVSAACGGNRASGGPADSVTLRSSAPILVVENMRGNDYEIFMRVGELDQLLGTVRALRNARLPLVDIPSNRYVWFRARPIGTATAQGVLSWGVEFAGQRQLTWIIDWDRPARVNAGLTPSTVVPPPSGGESERDPTGDSQYGGEEPVPGSE